MDFPCDQIERACRTNAHSDNLAVAGASGRGGGAIEQCLAEVSRASRPAGGMAVSGAWDDTPVFVDERGLNFRSADVDGQG